MLLYRRGDAALLALDAWTQASVIEIIAFDEAQALIARQAYIEFGKGRHAAGLNFADCTAYALASERNETLLFKRDNFPKTDVKPAI